MTRCRLFSLQIPLFFNRIQTSAGGRPHAGKLVCGVEPLTNTDRACAVAAAAAHDLNNELTVILNSVTGALAALDASHPAHDFLLELRAAAQRCAWKASGLLTFSARVNPHPVRASFEYLIEP
jgi:hypothetical protein